MHSHYSSPKYKHPHLSLDQLQMQIVYETLDMMLVLSIQGRKFLLQAP